MSTQTIVIGKTEPPKNLIPIEFLYCLNNLARAIVTTKTKPKEFKFIELISNNNGFDLSLDLMFAYDDPQRRDKGLLYLGKWNDGVVE